MYENESSYHQYQKQKAQNYNIPYTNTIYEFLFFIVPPERICIKDESGTERTSVVGPYSEGDIVKLKCDVFGGECNSTEWP